MDWGTSHEVEVGEAAAGPEIQDGEDPLSGTCPRWVHDERNKKTSTTMAGERQVMLSHMGKPGTTDLP